MLVLPALVLGASESLQVAAASEPATGALQLIVPSGGAGASAPDSVPMASPATAGAETAAVTNASPAAPPTTIVLAASVAHHVVSGSAPTRRVRSSGSHATSGSSRPAPSPTPRKKVPASQHSQTGQASWYSAPTGTCAHPSLPFGTVVSVTDTANGKSTTCTVEDRGPYAGDRILDLSQDTFSQLAPTDDGVIDVRIGW
jgi:rare lipoprotein A